VSKQKRPNPAAPRISKGGTVSLGSDAVPFTPRIQGITSDLSDLTFEDKPLIAHVGAAVADADLERTIEGASTIKLTIHDPNYELLEHPLLQGQFDVQVDDLWFRFVRVDKKLRTLELTFEDREVARLRLDTGPRKAFRDKMTRAEFIRMLVREDKKPAPIPFYCPELHVKQPIATAQAGRANQSTKLVTRQQGLPANADITVKHVKATPQQIRVIERALDTAVSLNAPVRALIAVVMCMTQENSCQTGGDGPFQQNPSWPGDPNDVENAATNFLKRAPTYPGGLLAYLRKNPHAPLTVAIQAIQKSGFPGAYAQWESEATHTVQQYLGGNSAPTVSASSMATAGEPQQKKKRYAFERKKNENTWSCGQRLAGEVHWRLFCSSGVIYYVAETDLLNSKLRATLADDTPGVDEITFTRDWGLPVTEVKVNARARAWAAPPGSVIEIARNGPANGRYIVADIRSKLGKQDRGVEITLKRPEASLPEPAASAATRSVSSSSSGNSKLDTGIARMNQLAAWHIPYVFGGGHGGFSQHPSSLDCSGAVSDVLHAMGFLSAPESSIPLEHFGDPGPGKLVTIYANAQHAWMEVLDGGHWRAWGTSVDDGGKGGLGWHPQPPAAYKAQFTKRHPPGM
jgi:hypothetical protein